MGDTLRDEIRKLADSYHYEDEYVDSLKNSFSKGKMMQLQVCETQLREALAKDAADEEAQAVLDKGAAQHGPPDLLPQHRNVLDAAETAHTKSHALLAELEKQYPAYDQRVVDLTMEIIGDLCEPVRALQDLQGSEEKDV